MAKQNKLGKLIALYDKFPQEVKVSCYIVVSYLIGQGLMKLASVQGNDALAAGLVNIALVFLKETKKRRK